MSARNAGYRLLKEQLKKIGINPKYAVEKLFPYWWDKNSESDEHSVMLLILHLSDILQIEAEKFWSAEMNPKDELISEAKFKKTVNKKDENIETAAAIAIKIGILCAEVCKTDYRPLSGDAETIRQEIIAQPGSENFERMLDYLWGRGIPVLPITEFPAKMKKPEGLCSQAGGRPFIILCRNDDDPAKLQFLTAHETGHIALNHLERGETLVDHKLSRVWFDSTGNDEWQANRFADEVNFGTDFLNAFPSFDLSPCHEPETFKLTVSHLARRFGLDPGPVARKILTSTKKHKYEKYFRAKGGLEIVRKKMLEYTYVEALSPEIRDSFLKMTGSYELYYLSTEKQKQQDAIPD